MSQPILLDLFCGAGGAATGYHRAGFHVVGIDINPQPDYPFDFIRADAVAEAAYYASLFKVVAVHASPPCQRFSSSTRGTGNPDDHPDLIDDIRQIIVDTGLPGVIENVPRAPVRRDVQLCGSMFGMRVRRHRVFEMIGWTPPEPPACEHKRYPDIVDVTGRPGGRNQTVPRPDGRLRKYYDTADARELMGMPWADWRGIVEAIPPAYTEWIGRHLMKEIT